MVRHSTIISNISLSVTVWIGGHESIAYDGREMNHVGGGGGAG